MRRLTAAILVGLMAGLPGFAQQQTGDGTFTMKVQTDIVLTNVVVRDKKTGGVVNVISNEEIEEWKKVVQPVTDGWVQDANSKGADGKALLKAAHDLISKYSR